MGNDGESLDRFLKFVESEKDVLAAAIRAFQLQHREPFLKVNVADERAEHSHAHMDVYQKYIRLLETFSDRFQQDQGMSEEDVVNMITHLQKNHPDLWTPFEV